MARRSNLSRGEVRQLLDDLRMAAPATAMSAVWRWRYEIALMAVGLILVPRLFRVTGFWVVLVALVCAVVVCVVVAPVRRFILARFWVVVMPHRLRVGFRQTRLFNGDGRIPWILHTRATSVGVCSWVWVPAGLCVDDFEDARRALAAACWTKDVRVTGHKRYSQLVRLDVIARDTLAADRVISSEVTGRVPRQRVTVDEGVTGDD